MKETTTWIGQKEFGPVIDITDPCHDKDVWCRINGVHIQEGIYDCYIKVRESVINVAGIDMQQHLVSAVGIHTSTTGIPTEDQVQYIGEIDVDAGLAGFFENKPDYTRAQWNRFCDTIFADDIWKQRALITTEGFFSFSGEGDGSYAVVGAKNEDGDYYALEIRFFDTIV